MSNEERSNDYVLAWNAVCDALGEGNANWIKGEGSAIELAAQEIKRLYAIERAISRAVELCRR